MKRLFSYIAITYGSFIWNSPRSFNPQFGEVAKKLGPLANFFVCADKALLRECGVRKSPSLVIYVDGEQVETYSGGIYSGKYNTAFIA